MKKTSGSKIAISLILMLAFVVLSASEAYSQKVLLSKASLQKTSSPKTPVQKVSLQKKVSRKASLRKVASKVAPVKEISTQNDSQSRVYYDTITKQKYLLVEVHKTYENVLNKGYESVEMLEYLGNFYFKCSDYKKSKVYFDRLFKNYKVSQISPKSIEQYESLASCIITN